MPAWAELLADSVSMLLPVAGLVSKDAVTPLGKLYTLRVTSPLNPFRLVTVTLLVTVPPWVTNTEGNESATVYVGTGDAVMVCANPASVDIMSGTLAMTQAVDVPRVAVLLAVIVTTLVPVVVGFGLNVAVTPGDRSADSVTGPAKAIVRFPVGTMVTIDVSELP